MSGNWKGSLTFSDRLANTVKLTAIYKAAHPDIIATEASKNARLLETEIFNESHSVVDYQIRCQAAIEELESRSETVSAPAPETNEATAERLLSSASAKAKFGRYKNAAHFKGGLFSEVFVAQVPSDSGPCDLQGKVGAYVGLKATHLSSMMPPHNSEREIRIMKSASGPNIMPLWESFYDGAGHLVLISPFMPLSLEQLILAQNAKAGGKAEGVNQIVKSCLKDIFRALVHLHQMGIIHRDVKPSNVLLESSSGPAYLTDFGIAWSPTDPSSEKPAEKISDVGTTCYRPPELLFGDTTYDTSLDLWPAGCVVAEALLGHGKSLFDPGELGSELTLIMSIFQSLGTPNEENWPEISKIPDWGKMNFIECPTKSWNELLPNSTEEGRDLVSKLVRYSGSQRLSAEKALAHPFFNDT